MSSKEPVTIEADPYAPLREAPKLSKYLIGTAAFFAPAAFGICYVKGYSLSVAAIATGILVAFALIPWLGLVLCVRNGGKLCRKLTRPLG